VAPEVLSIQLAFVNVIVPPVGENVTPLLTYKPEPVILNEALGCIVGVSFIFK